MKNIIDLYEASILDIDAIHNKADEMQELYKSAEVNFKNVSYNLSQASFFDKKDRKQPGDFWSREGKLYMCKNIAPSIAKICGADDHQNCMYVKIVTDNENDEMQIHIWFNERGGNADNRVKVHACKTYKVNSVKSLTFAKLKNTYLKPIFSKDLDTLITFIKDNLLTETKDIVNFKWI